MLKLKKISLIIMIVGYVCAGINHFRKPLFYINIIPHYIPYHAIINILAGGFEILLALMLIFSKTRHWGAWGIILMLIAFLPVHIQMIADAPLKLGSSMIKPLMVWLRLLLQPVLILWAWWYTKTDNI